MALMVSPIRIPNLTAATPIVDAQGRPTPAFQRYINDAFQQLVTFANAIEQIPEIQTALAAAEAATAAAQAAATAANTAASQAQASADATTAATSLANSYVTGLTLTATDAGASVTVSISAHTRVYGDGTSVAVNAGTVTGLPYSTLEYIYYHDPSRAGGAVTYMGTTDDNAAAQVGDVHTVGSVTTPAAAGAAVTGKYVRPPGVAGIQP